MKFLRSLYILSSLVFIKGAVSQIKVIPAITHVSCPGSTNGSVKLTPSGTGTPYTYLWTPGSTTGNSVLNQGFGNYQVTIQNASTATLAANYNIGYKTKWQGFYPGMITSTNGDTLINSTGSSTWLKTAEGVNVIPASSDGWIEYVVTTTGHNKIFGFLDAGSPSGWNNIDFGMILNSGGTVNTVNNGSQVSLGTYAVGDVLRIEKVSNYINYKKNNTVIWTTTITLAMVATNFQVRAALHDVGARLENLGCSVSANLTPPNANAGSSATITCTNPTAVLTGSSSTSGAIYSWSPGGATTATLNVSSSGTYTLKVTDPSSGCVNTATTAVIGNTIVPVVSFGSIPTGSLIGYWPFTGNASDMSGSGNHGTVSGAALSADRFGISGRAYWFNGSSDYIKVAHSASVDMNNSGDYTIAFWMKAQSVASDVTPLAKHKSDGSWNGYMFMRNTTDMGYCYGPGKFSLYAAAGANDDACADNLVSNDVTNWIFVTGQYKGATNQVKLYINSVLQSDIGSRAGTLSNTKDLFFGAHDNASGFFQGYLDDIRFYNRILSQDEINALYNEGGYATVLTCASFGVVLTGTTTTSGATYSWSPGGATTPTLNVVTAGTYTLKVTNPANGCASSNTTTVTYSCNEALNYFILKKVLDGSYYTSHNNNIYFAFEEEYFDPAQGSANSLDYKIVTDKNVPVATSPGLIEVIGDNRFKIDLTTVTGMIAGRFYRIAITNKKNEVFYARFKY